MKMLFQVVLIGCSFIFSSAALADVIVSKNGDKLSGKLINFNQQSLTYAPNMGSGQMEIEWNIDPASKYIN